MQWTPWFDREFPNAVPYALWPTLVERLRGAPDRLDALIATGDAFARAMGGDGEWSARRHAGHLTDLEPLWIQRVREFEAGAPGLSPADLSNRTTADADHDASDPLRLAAAFRTARAALCRSVEDLSDAQRQHRARHPRLGIDLGLTDHLFFVAEHDDHHLARIRGLLCS